MNKTNPYARLWRHETIIWHWPDKPDWTLEMVRSGEVYLPMDQEIILITDEQGRVFEWTTLDNWKGLYEVTENDPQKALEECLVKRDIPPITQNDIVDMVDSLGIAAVDNMADLDGIQEQIDLIGVVLEELIMIQLERPYQAS